MKNVEVKNVNEQNIVSEEKTLNLLDNIRTGSLENLPMAHPRFAGLMPLDEDSYKSLEDMIRSEGRITSPIITCIIDGVEYILDGHMRVDIAKKNDITNFLVQTLSNINTVEEGVCWIICNACSHRKLNKAQRVDLVRKLKPMIQEIAKTNQKLGAALKRGFSEVGKKTHTDCTLARMAGTSPDFFRDADFVFEYGTPDDRKKLLDSGYRASTIRRSIEKKQQTDALQKEVISYINPKEGDYINRIINGNCIQIMKDMAFNGINNAALMLASINYNVGIDYCPDFSDKLPRDEYLENIAQSIYYAQLLGRNGMRICINCTDTNNPDATDQEGDFQFDIGRDLCNKVDELNRNHKDCNLRFMGRFIWFKNNSSANPCLGSKAAPVIKNDSEYILVWTKNQRKLENISGIDCKPGSGSFASDAIRDKYIITEQERMAWSYQTWSISPCRDKELLKNHPCPYPEEICHRLIKLFSNPGDIVIDPYMGSGTTCLVADDLMRKYVGIDICSNFCDAAKKRIEARNNTIDDLTANSSYAIIA